jgi:hypothetical protein
VNRDEWAVVAGIQQGVMPGFSEHAMQEERMARVNDFAATADVVVAIVDVEEILHGGG